jgi:DNA-binding CsgD family transcriptional regulator
VRVGGRVKDLERAIGAIYDTVFDPEHWKEAAVKCARLADSSTLFLQTLDTDTGVVNVLSGHGLEVLGIDAYESHFHKVDIWRNALLAAPRGRIQLYHEMVEQPSYENSEVFNDWVKPGVGYDVYWGMGGTLNLWDQRYLAFLATHRTRTQGAMSEREQGRFQALIPHIQRVLHLRGLFDNETSRAGNLEAMSDACRDAMLVVDRNARLLHANRRALALLSAGHPVLRLRKDGTLEASLPTESQALQRQVRVACSRDREDYAKAAGYLRLTRSNGQRLVATVTPVRANRGALKNECVLIAIRDAWAPRRIEPEKIAMVFDLSRAESRLVAKLFEGHTLRGAAEQLGLSYHTVRTQLANALAKAGFSRQSDLMLRVARLSEE